MIFDICVSYLLYQRSLILKLFLRCDWKIPVGRIQNEHTYLPPPSACGRLCWRCRFLLFCLSPSRHLLVSRQFLKLFKFEVVWVIFGPRKQIPFWINPSQIFSKWYKHFQQKVVFSCCLCFETFLVVNKIFDSRGTKKIFGYIL